MKVVSLNGSPKGIHSGTHVMMDALLKGLQSPDSEIFNVFLSDQNIHYCAGCYSCWFKTPGQCVIDDDMKELIELMADTDILMLGSPLFFSNISGTLKVFVDRLTAAGGDPRKKAEARVSGDHPRLIMVSNCGFPDRSQFEVVSLWINNVARMMGAPLIGEFYATNGRVLTQPADHQRKSRSRYLEFMENCGRQFLDKMELREEQKALLHRDILEF
jgi:FMN-dependent NADH-azoreductase